MKPHRANRQYHSGILILAIALTILSACTNTTQTAILPSLPSTSTQVFIQTSSPFPPTSTPLPSPTPVPPTSTPQNTPQPLARFLPTGLPASISSVAYITDTCQYLTERWKEGASQPGTIVVPVMFHSIAAPGRAITDDTTISEEYFYRFMERAHELGFRTIKTEELIGFLYHNQTIPSRALYLVVDDRKRGEYFEKYFAPYQKKYGWTVTNAWISHPDTPEYLYKENETFIATGLVDFQAHGVIHNTPIEPDSPTEYVRNEIFGPLTVIKQHFGKPPLAFIWPRGLFTPQAVQMARQAGYQLGFTTLPRGPLLYNWLPVGKEELQSGDPLLVLPRYWSTTAISSLDAAVAISSQAQAFAAANRQRELDTVNYACKTTKP